VPTRADSTFFGIIARLLLAKGVAVFLREQTFFTFFEKSPFFAKNLTFI
jgi:hypothetical protein